MNHEDTAAYNSGFLLRNTRKARKGDSAQRLCLFSLWRAACGPGVTGPSRWGRRGRRPGFLISTLRSVFLRGLDNSMTTGFPVCGKVLTVLGSWFFVLTTKARRHEACNTGIGHKKHRRHRRLRSSAIYNHEGTKTRSVQHWDWPQKAQKTQKGLDLKMPTISMFYGILVTIFYQDTGRHNNGRAL